MKKNEIRHVLSDKCTTHDCGSHGYQRDEFNFPPLPPVLQDYQSLILWSKFGQSSTPKPAYHKLQRLMAEMKEKVGNEGKSGQSGKCGSLE